MNLLVFMSNGKDMNEAWSTQIIWLNGAFEVFWLIKIYYMSASNYINIAACSSLFRLLVLVRKQGWDEKFVLWVKTESTFGWVLKFEIETDTTSYLENKHWGNIFPSTFFNSLSILVSLAPVSMKKINPIRRLTGSRRR